MRVERMATKFSVDARDHHVTEVNAWMQKGWNVAKMLHIPGDESTYAHVVVIFERPYKEPEDETPSN